MRCARLAMVAMVVVAMVVTCGVALAVPDFTWNGGTAAWDLTTNWTPNPVAADFTNAAKEFLATGATGGILNCDSTPTFAAKLTIQGNGNPDAYSGATLRFNEETLVANNLHLDGGRLYPSEFGGGQYTNGSIGAGTTLTVDSASYIDMSNVQGGRNVNMNGPIAGSGNLAFKGGQNFYVNSANNAYNGTWIINGPIVIANATNCLGTGTVTINSGMLAANSAINVLTGTGITANAGGTLGLQGTCNVGVAHLNGGVLRNSGDGGNATGTFYVDVDTTFRPSESGGKNLGLTGAIIGAAARTITVGSGGDAWFTLNTDNSLNYAGAWVVNKGRLGAAATNAFGSGTVTANTGTIVQVKANINSLTGNGITMNSGSYFEVGASCTVSSVHVNGATIRTPGGSQTLSGNIYVDSPSTLTSYLDGGKVFSLNAVFHGSQKMIFNAPSGYSRVWLNADNSADFSGGWDVNVGTLEITHAKGLGTGPVTVANGATLALDIQGSTPAWTLVNNFSGSGIVKVEDALRTLTLQGSTVSPGTSVGTLRIDGNLVLSNAANLAIEIANGGVCDLLDVNGTVNLGTDSILQLTIPPGCDPTTTPYLIIDNDGTTDPIGGSGFASITGAGRYDMLVNYTGGDGNDVVLTFKLPVPEPAGLGLVGLALLAVRRRRS